MVAESSCKRPFELAQFQLSERAGAHNVRQESIGQGLAYVCVCVCVSFFRSQSTANGAQLSHLQAS